MNRLLSNARASVLPLAILMLVLVMVVPIPAFMLDIFFVANIAISLAVLMVALNAQKPLDFSAFPTVLLFATLFRLGLNVASTRIVLVHGHEGESAAGHVIEAFGTFLIGGDYVVGIFVFAILMIINMIVVTKGAGRVSEVSARFTLDALPGKQMAIDADLNAGLITPDEAKARRIEVSTEADFYGSMDGSSKFVKGDAVAAMLILAANIIGGLILGPVSHGMSIADAAHNYILLAIGDALVAQLPSLMLSIAAASIVTRVTSDKDLAGQIGGQFGSPRTWTPVAVILALLGVLPGMPHMVILPAAAIAGFAAWKLRQIERRPAPVVIAPVEAIDQSKIGWDEVTDGMQVNLDIGYGLVPLVDDRRGSPLMGRITGVRRQLSKELGFVVPQVRVRDDINLAPYVYRIIVNGVVVGEDTVSPDDMLALDTGQAFGSLIGKTTKDPTFGLDATWISTADADAATGAGYLVVDPGTVVATHLNHLLGQTASDLLGPDEVQALLDGLKERAAQLVTALAPIPITTLTQVLKGLLAENIPLKEFRSIAAAIAVAAQRSQDAEEIIELIRPRLGALIIQKLCGMREPLRVMTLEGHLEGLLGQAMRADQSRRHVIEPDLGRRIVEALQNAAQPLIAEAKPFALVVQPAIRLAIRKLVRTCLPDTPVMSFFEVPEDKAVEVVAVIGAPQQALAA
ncbi:MULTISPECIES: flagellar biosynthesis protein FlhA [unclassified Sphingomonas]|jgi:flagellar biosynthesis protein FlhA|uniref:flagellar biosynthesis protein FlhA n=1 Tax=unclassified Sphingomonas TaxID=196159 RepID=UPI0006F72388|nr:MULTISPECIES: flagellar biosynthesis protein FlhA [unclassified Sphingomonas]KQN21504.1 flagellar biosynthesis protein FlhA [Sphingomonas sp. Leaf30]MBD8552274.1 flagellar biosynthesis protein FlhA [Sphingomonas sp. CFBP 8764]MBD8698255.1 flagellar biosynthesis protein FlhA [Sphingomonas sp. CFBP 13714]MBD8736727.1 flagellar biosynthesis protein FlhA [Sphingomonas sp. CFBP 13706]MBP2513681.1 flagellar biosynthesis protein FlhA [Sphingomonas sp. PvP018]